MGKPSIIAIDGPAASGKSTLAEKVATYLGYLYFDTGVMYRAVTLAVLQSHVTVEDEDEVSTIAEKVNIDVQPASFQDGRKNDILLDGKDNTWQILEPEVEANVSLVASYRRVRQAMTDQQRRIGCRGHVVMVGRDIGTVVFPDADLKIYLDASCEVRARRRFEERRARGEIVAYEQVLEGMLKRDQIDSSREIAPLRAAADAVVIQSDGSGIDEIFQKVLQVINARLS
jgi:CMP/dCMP kinase